MKTRCTVKGVVNKVMLGEGDAGMVFLTDGRSAEGQIQLVLIPDAVNVEAVYPIAVLKSTLHGDEARAFVEFVLSDEGQQILQKYGFLPPESML
ncbi:extracellular solute-binding protein [Anaerolinea thermophila]|uniref:extracellular solute-binding protein n=1 Tax=Anaerolinea thermophila TaxID=167964 RepID=UPI0030B2B75C